MVSNRPSARRDGGLGPDPVGRGHDDGLADAVRDRERRSEAAEPAQDLRAAGRLDRGAHELHGAVAGRDVDAGPGVRHAREGRPLAHPPAPLPTVSSRNLRAETSYGTGTG